MYNTNTDGLNPTPGGSWYSSGSSDSVQNQQVVRKQNHQESCPQLTVIWKFHTLPKTSKRGFSRKEQTFHATGIPSARDAPSKESTSWSARFPPAESWALQELAKRGTLKTHAHTHTHTHTHTLTLLMGLCIETAAWNR